MEFITQFKKLTSTHLKLIALITMTLDHFAAVLLPYGTLAYTILRALGRISFPLYCFLLAEGYFYTKDHKAYLKRLFLFAVISELPFDMAFFGFPLQGNASLWMSHQNVFFTLFTGFLVLFLCDRVGALNSMNHLVILFAAAFLAEFLNFDYGCFGVFVIFLFYYGKRFHSMRDPLLTWFLALLPLLLAGQINGFMILFVLPLLLLYNGTKGPDFPGMKYLFYCYYPLHLILFALISML